MRSMAGGHLMVVEKKQIWKSILPNIGERENQFGKTFRVRLKFKGKWYTATRDTLREAITWRDETLDLLRRGETLPGDLPAGDMTLGEASDRFIQGAEGVKARGTVAGYRYAQTQFLAFFGEHRLLSAIKPALVSAYLAKRRKEDQVGDSKIYAELSILRMIYETAAAWGVEIDSPERKIKRPKKRTASRDDRLLRVIQPEEMTAILDAALNQSPLLARFLLFLLFTGMRPSEAASLRWQPLPAKKEATQIRERRHVGYVDLARGGFSRVGTKTETRFVPGHPVALAVVAQLQTEEENTEGSFVFLPDDHGQADRPYLFFRWGFRRARMEARTQDHRPIRDSIDFYSFRHTARSRMAVCGVQDSAAELIIGHDGREMQRTYTHYSDKDLVREIGKLDYPWLDDFLRKISSA